MNHLKRLKTKQLEQRIGTEINNMETKKTSKRGHTLIFATGGKGGVGKTFALLTLCDALKAAGRKHVLLDADQENMKTGGLSAYLPNVAPINLRDELTIDNLLLSASEHELTICDMPANAGGDFHDWFADAASPEALAELDLRLIALGVITAEAPSVASVFEWAETMQDSCDYAIAMNRRREMNVIHPPEVFFRSYFDSPPGKSFRSAMSPIEVVLPGVHSLAIAAWDGVKGLASSACENGSVPVIQRSRLRKLSAQSSDVWAPFIKAI